jgi:hypothetical protein
MQARQAFAFSLDIKRRHTEILTTITLLSYLTVKPKKTYIKFSQNPAVLDTSVTITCESRGFPEPIYTITVNATIIVAYGSERIRTIGKVKWNDTGLYCCTTSNELGSDLDFEFLRVTGKIEMNKFVQILKISILPDLQSMLQLYQHANARLYNINNFNFVAIFALLLHFV